MQSEGNANNSTLLFFVYIISSFMILIRGQLLIVTYHLDIEKSKHKILTIKPKEIHRLTK